MRAERSNPHEMLDYVRFISSSAIRFCKLQSEIIRRYKKPGDFITTNGLFGHLDNHRLAGESLDVYSYDSYPNFAYDLSEDPQCSDDLNDRKWSRNLSEVRSVCPHFAILEQQSGANGWNSRMQGPAPKPGQMMLWAMQSIAHGADYVSFFRWRTATKGTEIYWHGILDYDNRDNRKLAELNSVFKRTQAIQGVSGADYLASVGLLRDYDNIWDSEIDIWHGNIAKKSEKAIFVAAQLLHTPLDMPYLREDTEAQELSRYAVLFYPHPLILTEEKARVLREYVEGGGTLILGARAGMKDVTGQCVMAPMPGPLAHLTGTNVRDFTFVGAMDGNVAMDWNGSAVDTGVFNDVIEADASDAHVLAAYSSNYYKGAAALVERIVSKGKVLHFGGTFTKDNTAAFLRYTGVIEPWADAIRLPEACELAVREKDGNRFFFVLNYGWSEQEIDVLQEMTDLDNGERVRGTVRLAPFETKVFGRDIDVMGLGRSRIARA